MCRKITVLSMVVILVLAFGVAIAEELTPIETLGKFIFFDENLSLNKNQSCATCHGPEVGWAGPDAAINAAGAVYEGSVPEGFGNRKPPSAAYATASPILHFVVEKKEPLFIGGNFWDGRATGEKLGNPAADQAQGPFLNPVEHALPAAADVVEGVCSSTYGFLFNEVWGVEACEEDHLDAAYDQIALSIAAYEASYEVNAFTSKYDYYQAGLAQLTKQEKNGLNFFKGKGKCARCHILNPGPDNEPPLLTDFTFDNLGIPRNPENPFYDMDEFNPLKHNWVDLGLGGFLSSRMDYQHLSSKNLGKQKVPTLRNVDKRPAPDFVKAFGHNGYFKSLKGIVHFYNTRDAKPRCPDPFTTESDAVAQDCWPEPEVEANVNTAELGNLHLNEMQEDAIVAFLKTLTDDWLP